MVDLYLDNVISILTAARETQRAALVNGAKLLCDATLSGGNIFAFGCSHASILALELYYRTGGMATINPVRAPGLNCDVDPATLTSQIERLPEYGAHIIDALPMRGGDVIIIHSVSGRNAVVIDAAIRSKEKGAKVIALTNLAMSKAVPARHPTGKNLYEWADVVIDNGGCVGDASIDVPGVPEKVGPTSTAVGAALLNAMVVETVSLIAAAGKMPPVFVSANVDGGDAHNDAMLEEYCDHIFYMGHRR